MRLTRSWQVLILSLLTAATLLLLTIRPEKEPVLRSLAPSPVMVSATVRVNLFPEAHVSGHLQTARRVWLRFEVEGAVAERLVEPGQSLAAGDALFSLADQDYRDAMIQAQAEWQQAQENLERDRKLLKFAERSRKLQEEEVARLNSLGERSLASKTRLGDSSALLAQRQSAEARLRASVITGPQRVASRKAALDRAQRNLDRTVLRAPFAGRVNQVLLEAGDYAGRNEKVLELVSTQLDFFAQVRGSVARALSLGQQVTVIVSDRSWQATVTAVQPDPDPATFTHAIRLRMPDAETRAGAAALALLPLQPVNNVLVVPVTAVLLEEGGAFVFRVQDAHLQRVKVQLGARVEQQQVITAGIEAGEQVVVRDVAALSDGQAVIVEALQAVSPGAR
ncbi:MAG TPA: efflux RND transporter periplasmic adaptor subunit [Gammaproteobacteria bacterium]|nr:efflux RND transporter periplasmic adaptor subunit [Gammaproteobacteria bacterium]